MRQEMFNDRFSENNNKSPIRAARQLPAVACFKRPTRCQLAQETPGNGAGVSVSAAPTGASSGTPPRLSCAVPGALPSICLGLPGARSAGSAGPPGARRTAEDGGSSSSRFPWAKGRPLGGAPFEGRPFTSPRARPDRVFGGRASGKDGPARPEALAGPSPPAFCAQLEPRERRTRRPAGRGTPTDHQAGDSPASPITTSPPTCTAPGHLHWGPQSREATAAHGLPLTASWEPCIRGPLLGGRLAVRPGFRVTTPPAPLARVSSAPLGSSLGFLITASPAVTFCSSPAPFCSSSASPFYCVITASLLDP